MDLGPEYPRRVVLSVSYHRAVTGGVNLDYLVKKVFLHCKVTSVHFVIGKCLGKNTLRVCKYPASPQSFSIHWWVPSAAVSTESFA